LFENKLDAIKRNFATYMKRRGSLSFEMLSLNKIENAITKPIQTLFVCKLPVNKHLTP